MLIKKASLIAGKKTNAALQPYKLTAEENSTLSVLLEIIQHIGEQHDAKDQSSIDALDLHITTALRLRSYTQ